MEAGSGINIRHYWIERESQLQTLCWQKLNHSSLPLCCVRQHHQNPPQPSLSSFCDPADEDLIKLSLMPRSFAQRVCSASSKYNSSNSQNEVLLTSAGTDGSCRPSSSPFHPHLPPPPGTEAAGDGGGQRTRAQLEVPGLRPEGSTEDKANITLNFSSSKLNWETKEGKLNRVGVPAPELSSAEAAFLLHSFSLWLLCKQFSGCVFLAQSTESYDS